MVIGDFNVHFDKCNDTVASHLDNDMQILQLKQWVKGPTHNAGHTLDLLFSNIDSTTVEEIKPITWADHSLITFSFTQSVTSVKASKPTHELYRAWKSVTPESFQRYFIFNNLEALGTLPTNRGVMNLETEITNTLDQCAPKRKLKCTKRNMAEKWYTSEVKALKRKCKLWEHKWRISRLDTDTSTYKAELWSYNYALKKAKSTYFEQ